MKHQYHVYNAIKQLNLEILFKYAKDLKADALVTGHYVSRIQSNGHANMYRAKDQNRDQSYFLFSTTQEQLDYLRFPLGEIDKSETRSNS